MKDMDNLHWFTPTPEQLEFHKPTETWTTPMGIIVILGKQKEDDNSG